MYIYRNGFGFAPVGSSCVRSARPNLLALIGFNSLSPYLVLVVLDLDSNLSVLIGLNLPDYTVWFFLTGLDSHLTLLGPYWAALTVTLVCSLLGMIHAHAPSSLLGFAIVLVLHIPKTPFVVFIFYSLLNYPMFYQLIFLDMCIVFIQCALLDGRQH